MNPKEKGEISEAKILARFRERGYNVLTPWGDSQRYDLVLDIDGEFLTVQCKTARRVEGNVKFKCRSNNWNSGKTRNYKGEVDLFAVYSPDLQSCFIVPVEDAGTKAMSLRFKQPKKKSPNITWAVDYIF